MTTKRPPSPADVGIVAAEPEATLALRLYVALPTPTSLRAAANLQKILESLGSAADVISLEVIDVTIDPIRALKDRIIVTPTLMCACAIEHSPIIGDLSDAVVVRDYLVTALQKKSG